MEPWFVATEKFGPASGQSWKNYQGWSKLSHLTELVTLDPALCPTVLSDIKKEYWPYIVNEDFMIKFFVDFEFFMSQVSDYTEKNILCVFRNPPKPPTLPRTLQNFAFLGYDLTDVEVGTSALSNCGEFPEVFVSSDLSTMGLLTTHSRAVEVQAKLRELYPNESHANCHFWAIFRKIDK
jgi:hypothetical protein